MLFQLGVSKAGVGLFRIGVRIRVRVGLVVFRVRVSVHPSPPFPQTWLGCEPLIFC